MLKKYKQLIKKHVNVIKSMHPEVYIEVTMIYDDILIGIASQDVSKENQYEALIVDFIKEYDRKGFYNIYWAVDFSITSDNLHLLEDDAKTSKKISA